MTPFEKLCALRWPDGIRCPHCGHGKVYYYASRPTLTCASKLCRRQFSPSSGTVFHSRKMPIEQYLAALEAFPSCKSPSDMHRALDSDYRTAFNIFHALQSTNGKLL
jgi:hypothetical protein